MNNISCKISRLNSSIFILNCDYFVCSDCYEVIKSLIEEDKEIYYSCEKEIILSKIINLKKKKIINQNTIYNTKENNYIILSKLKVSNNFFSFYSLGKDEKELNIIKYKLNYLIEYIPFKPKK